MKITKRKSQQQLSGDNNYLGQMRATIVRGAFGLAATLLFATQLFASTIVNINTADAKKIAESLDGIGPVKAQAIVAYRNKNGLFSDASDIMKVTGIGEATYELLKAYLTIGSSQSKVEAGKNKTSAVTSNTKQAVASSN